MNVERLSTLASVAREECHEFGSIRLGLSMNTVFSIAKPENWSFNMMTGGRFKEMDPKPTHFGCLVAYTLFLNDKKEMLLCYHSDDFRVENCVAEAQNILGLDNEKSNALFFGNNSPRINGEDAYRVIRKFLITGDVDWFLLQR